MVFKNVKGFPIKAPGIGVDDMGIADVAPFLGNSRQVGAGSALQERGAAAIHAINAGKQFRR